MRSAKCTLKRKKSISSHAASISAWCAVFDWPSIVAPLTIGRYRVASRSAALRNTAARRSNPHADHSRHASPAADDEGNLELAGGELLQGPLELRPLRGPRGVAQHGLVDGGGDLRDAVHGEESNRGTLKR